VIYDLIDDLRNAMEGLLEPAEVTDTFGILNQLTERSP